VVTVAVTTSVPQPVRHVGQLTVVTVTVGVTGHAVFAQGTERVVLSRRMQAGAGPQTGRIGQ
jgi:uncharacterized membrane protein